MITRSDTGRTTVGLRSVGAPGRAGRAAGGRRGAGTPALPPTAPKVRVPELLLGILVVAGCALGAALWYSSTTGTREALVLARAVERGHVFEASDFAAAQVNATGMRLVAYADRDQMVGRVAATDLEAASPVTESVALVQVPLGVGESLVGARLEAGDFPAELSPGAIVNVILVVEHATSPDAQPTKESITLEQPATVEAVEPLENLADTYIATLRLPTELARDVAAADGVRLVQVGA